MSLTAHARRLEPALAGVARGVNTAAARGIPDAEVDACLRTLTRMIANLETVSSGTPES